MEIIDKIRKIRVKKGISHETMAIHLGITQSTYTKFEKNGLDLTVKRLFKIAEILETPVQELLGIGNVFHQTHNQNAAAYQNIEYFTQENKDIYEKLLKSKDEQIELLKSLLGKQ